MSENPPRLLTYDEYLALPEGRYEIIDGVLYEPPPPRYDHQNIVGRLHLVLGNFLAAQPELGEVMLAPFEVRLRLEPPLAVEPDLLFVSAANLARLGDERLDGPPDLAVEVVSPSNSRHDAIRKRELYGRYGVQEYWLIWPGDERIDVFSQPDYLQMRTVGKGERLETALLPGFSLDVTELFKKRGA
jgi:Uma2 family endonuclease